MDDLLKAAERARDLLRYLDLRGRLTVDQQEVLDQLETECARAHELEEIAL